MPKEKCWEVRGCDADMLENCAFGSAGVPCKISCYFTVCPGDKYEVIDDFSDHPAELDLEQYGVNKQQCAACKVFIRYVKKAAEQER